MIRFDREVSIFFDVDIIVSNKFSIKFLNCTNSLFNNSRLKSWLEFAISFFDTMLILYFCINIFIILFIYFFALFTWFCNIVINTTLTKFFSSIIRRSFVISKKNFMQKIKSTNEIAISFITWNNFLINLFSYFNCYFNRFNFSKFDDFWTLFCFF